VGLAPLEAARNCCAKKRVIDFSVTRVYTGGQSVLTD